MGAPGVDPEPWRREALDAVVGGVPTMVSDEERRYLHWLARTVWSGAGCVLEIGPWLGGSTVCLAAGMSASGHPASGRLHVVDNFVWREFMAGSHPLPLRPGESFESLFRAHTAAYSDLIRVHAMALPDEVIPGDRDAAAKRAGAGDISKPFQWDAAVPLEILFIDGAKSWRGLRGLLGCVNPCLLPGRTWLVCQDYKHWGAYWVAMILTRLEPYLTPRHDLRSGTTVSFTCDAPIPQSALDALEEGVAEVAEEDGRALLARASERLAAMGDLFGHWSLRLAQVRFLAHKGLLEGAEECFREVRAGWPSQLPQHPLERTRAYLEGRLGRRLPRRGAWQLLSRAARRLGIGRGSGHVGILR